ncbi:MAG TPA: carboxypeptidase-like regulatory domain-containing protein [Chitinophagaceae bacterium]|nr:carboxypeptidase-like regulatory domain-containing protein [Chitinophagaceae bacterium]
MVINRLLLSLLFIGFSILSTAQFVITGTVVDSASKEPLVNASVFCQNTTLGTVTDKEGKFSLSLKSGGYDLIFSYTGYLTQTVRVTENNRIDIQLVKEEKSMGEVVLRNTYEVADGWTKYGDFFFQNFIGSTPNAEKCTLLNPEVLKFYYYKRTNRLKVLATDAIQIANHALGYNLRYQLDSFVYFYNTHVNSYRGYCLYTEMEADDSTKQVWSKARAKAYEGSKLHFMRSYYDSSLYEDGWVIDMLDEKNEKKFNRVDNPYDTLYYGALDSTLQIEIWFPRKLSIAYTNKKPEPEYLKKMGLPKNVQYPISYIDIKETIAITENGYYYEQKDWINQGYWSWKNVADLLPYDYLPD